MSEQKFSIKMIIDRKTKGTYRFVEVGDDIGLMAFRTLYVRKYMFDEEPKRIRVTVEVLE